MAIQSAEVIGVDIGGTNTRIVQVNENGVYEETYDKYRTPEDPGEFLHNLGKRLVRLADDSGVTTVVMGIPGPVQWQGETAVSVGPLPNIAGFRDTKPFDLRARLIEEVPAADKLDIYTFNDAHIQAQAAVRLLVPEGYTNEQPHITILVSTGVGGDFLVDYRSAFSNRNIPGEIGHIGVGHPPVSIENLVSGTAVAKRFGRTTEELVTAIDPAAEAIWKEVGETLAIGFGNFMAVFDPDRFAFAGSVSAYGAHRFLQYFESRMHDIAYAGRAVNVMAPEIDIVPSKLVDELALRGTIWAYQGLRPIPAV